MARYRRKLEEVEAVRWDGTAKARDDAQKLGIIADTDGRLPLAASVLYIGTANRDGQANLGDWIVKGPGDMLAVYSPEDFAALFEPI